MQAAALTFGDCFADGNTSLFRAEIGDFMRSFVCALLLVCPLVGQQITRDIPESSGTFFVDGITYQYAARADCTVVVAAHSVINRKFLGVKVRVYNAGQRSISVKPDDIAVEDAIASRELAAVSGAELARRMRKPQNMARFAVNGIGGAPLDGPITSDMVNPAFLEMMKAMAARTNGMPTGKSVLYTDTPGAFDAENAGGGPIECDQVCGLRNREAQGNDALTQLQHPSSADAVEQFALLANTIPPHANVGGVLYFPLGKLSEAASAGEHGKKGRRVRVSVPVMGEEFRFELPVE